MLHYLQLHYLQKNSQNLFALLVLCLITGITFITLVIFQQP